MWRWRRQRTWLVAMVFAPTYLSSPTEDGMAPRCSPASGLTSAAAAVSIADCAGLEALPAPIVEDLSLSFDGVEAIVCEKVRSRCACRARAPLSSLAVPSFIQYSVVHTHSGLLLARARGMYQESTSIHAVIVAVSAQPPM